MMHVTVCDCAEPVSEIRAAQRNVWTPHSWSTHDKMDVGVAESAVPQVIDLVQV
jgi:hypothetical protein